jgi:hypothetical protein
MGGEASALHQVIRNPLTEERSNPAAYRSFLVFRENRQRVSCG